MIAKAMICGGSIEINHREVICEESIEINHRDNIYLSILVEHKDKSKISHNVHLFFSTKGGLFLFTFTSAQV